MSDSRKIPQSIRPELYSLAPDIKFDAKSVVFTDKSWELIKQGLLLQEFVINSYIDSETGAQTLHGWPTGYEESSCHNDRDKYNQKSGDVRLKASGYKEDEIVRALFDIPGVVHSRGAALDLKKYDLTQCPYLAKDAKKTVNRLGGAIRKVTQDTKGLVLKGRSTVNWKVFILNEVFEYAYYYSGQGTLDRSTSWPKGVHFARSLPFQVIEGWIAAIEKRNNCDISPLMLDACKRQCHSLTGPEVSQWQALFDEYEDNRKGKLSQLIMGTMYIAAGLRKNKEASLVRSDEEVVLGALAICKKYDILINLEYIPPHIKEEDTKGATALMHAVLLGKKQTVETLLAHGANIHVVDAEGRSVLDYALLGGNEKVYELLLAAGADESKEISPEVLMDEKGKGQAHHFQFFKCFIADHKEQQVLHSVSKSTKDTLLHAAVKKGKLNIVELLLKEKCDPNTQNIKGITALHMAVTNNRLDIIVLLLKHNANPAIATHHGLTAFDVAIQRSNMPAITIILPYLSDTMFSAIQQRHNLNPGIKALFDVEQEKRSKQYYSLNT